MVSGGLTLTMCSGTPTETEVVRWRALLVGACCGVEFLVVSVGQYHVVCSSCGAVWCIVVHCELVFVEVVVHCIVWSNRNRNQKRKES